MPEILKIEGLTKKYKKKLAIRDVSFSLNEGEYLGVVGESGCGKSTLMELIAGLERPTSGIILRARPLRLHMVFQNPAASFNPRMTIGRSLREGLLNQGLNTPEAKARIRQLLQEYGLPEEYADRYPSELSGGECQRAAIIRAVAVNPDVLICDEATSALDVLHQRQIILLLYKLLRTRKMAIIFVSHDLALVQEICTRIIVMKEGSIIEEGSTYNVINHPQAGYTKALLNAVL